MNLGREVREEERVDEIVREENGECIKKGEKVRVGGGNSCGRGQRVHQKGESVEKVRK